MAITIPTIIGPGLMPIVRLAPWAINNDEDDANGAAVSIKTAPGTGYSLYLEHLTLSGRTADIAITLRDGATDVLFGPIQMQADGSGTFTKDWPNPIKLTTNTALYVYASVASAFTVYVEGFTGKDKVS